MEEWSELWITQVSFSRLITRSRLYTLFRTEQRPGHGSDAGQQVQVMRSAITRTPRVGDRRCILHSL